MMLTVGQRVAAVDTVGRLHKAVVCPVPKWWRDSDRSATVTSRGEFPKVWLSFDGAKPLPWPVQDVMTDPEQVRKYQALWRERIG